MNNPPPIDIAITHVLTGKVSPLGHGEELSAIKKIPASGPLCLTKTGFAGDEQADRRYHGGPEKAVHHFPAEHYLKLAERFPGMAFSIGNFGENISSSGITEAGIYLGDVFSLGSAVIQLSQGRQPCWKLNVRFNAANMARLIQETGWTGWYYRVLEEGIVSPGDRLRLLERPYPQADLAHIQRVMYLTPLDFAELGKLAELPPLPPSWRKTFLARLETGSVEDSSSRLETPAAPAGND